MSSLPKTSFDRVQPRNHIQLVKATLAATLKVKAFYQIESKSVGYSFFYFHVLRLQSVRG